MALYRSAVPRCQCWLYRVACFVRGWENCRAASTAADSHPHVAAFTMVVHNLRQSPLPLPCCYNNSLSELTRISRESSRSGLQWTKRKENPKRKCSPRERRVWLFSCFGFSKTDCEKRNDRLCLSESISRLGIMWRLVQRETQFISCRSCWTANGHTLVSLDRFFRVCVCPFRAPTTYDVHGTKSRKVSEILLRAASGYAYGIIDANYVINRLNLNWKIQTPFRAL